MGNIPEKLDFRQLFNLTLGRYFSKKNRPYQNSQQVESHTASSPSPSAGREDTALPIKPIDLMTKLKLIDEFESKIANEQAPISVEFRSKDGGIRYRTFLFSKDSIPEKSQEHLAKQMRITLPKSGSNEESQAKLKAERAALVVEAARSGMSEREWDTFCEQVSTLENRSYKRLPELSDKQITEIFKQIRRLLVNCDSCALSLPLRQRIATQILSMTLRPQDITQGNFYTCNVTVVENRIFTLEPEIAARLIANVVMHGKFQTLDGSWIYLNKEMLSPDSEALSLEDDGRRNLCSMVFQRSAVNVYWQRQLKGPDGVMLPKGSITYQQYEQSGVSFERLLDMSKVPPEELNDKRGQLASSPNLFEDNIMEVLCQLSEHVPHLIVLRHGAFSRTEQIAGLCSIRSLEHLHEILSGLNIDRGFPVFVLYPRHIVVIRAYDSLLKEVSLDNSYSSKYDFLGVEVGSQPRKKLHELFAEMRLE